MESKVLQKEYAAHDNLIGSFITFCLSKIAILIVFWENLSYYW